MSEPFVSVVVPTYERRASLARLIAALAVQTYPADQTQVIVVDDGSADGTAEWLRAIAARHDILILEQPHSGPSAARNRGVAEASGELVVFLDDDVVPDPGLLAAHVAAHRGGDDRVVIGPMLPPDSWKRPAWIRWEERKLVDQYRRMTEGLSSCTYRQFFTANASLRRDRFLASGGFDANFARAEDVDLGHRLHMLGMQFVFEPNARAWHYPHRSFVSWSRTPYRYGQADVAMERDKENPALQIAFDEFEDRRWLARALALLCVGRPPLFNVATFGLMSAARLADVAGIDRLASAALSGLFSMQYWQGVSDALGDPHVVSRAAARGHPTPGDGYVGPLGERSVPVEVPAQRSIS